MVFSNLNEINEKRLGLEISNIMLNEKNVPIFLCVGSDRVVGDCMSPMVGEQIKEKVLNKAIIFGTLNQPITYKNLQQTVDYIKKTYPQNPLIVIDSVLGENHEVGCVKFNKGGVVLGGEFHEGVMSGNYHIVGVVNQKGIGSLTFLKSVRIKKVLEMSKFISNAINYAVKFAFV